MAAINGRDVQDELNRALPAANHAKLGDIVADIITQYNALQADHANLVAKFNALLAHMDAGAVAGLGTAHAATYAPTAQTSKTTAVLGTR